MRVFTEIDERPVYPTQASRNLLYDAYPDNSDNDRQLQLAMKLATRAWPVRVATAEHRSLVGRLVYAGPVPACNIGQWARAIMATRTCAALRAPVARLACLRDRPNDRVDRRVTCHV